MRSLLALLAVIVLTLAPANAREGGPRLVLEEWFQGRSTGSGRFEIPLAGVTRDFTLTARGTWDGRVLTLVEDFVFADGERDRKTWRFTRTAPGRYVGTREDVVGTAEVFQDGDAVRLRYLLTIPGRNGGTPTTLGFDDIMYLRPDGVLINEATVTWFGLPIGSTRVEFRRAPQRR